MEKAQTKLLIPGLRPFYEWAEPLSWALVRITAGLMIIPHGWPKLMAGVGPVAANALAKRGIEPAEPLAVILSPPSQVRLDRARLRVPAHVGPGNARDSATRRRALLAGSQAGPRTLT